jgi:hypothetical protein
MHHVIARGNHLANLKHRPSMVRLALMKKLSFLIFILLMINTHADNTCSRTAVINEQEILVDTSYSERGEGLRYYLDKDPEAKRFLDVYQDGTRIKWQNAALGTLGTVLLIVGVLSDSDSKDKRTMILSGAGIMTVNFFVAKTMEATNERNLLRSIKEYNKRNLPRIYFSPDQDRKTGKRGLSLFFGRNWSF